MTAPYQIYSIPFANSGDLISIPVAAQPNGSISYTQGYGPNYELIQTDPNYLDVPRPQTNQIYYDITNNLQQYQYVGTFPFITAALNGGIPVPYTLGARVQYDDGTGLKNYESLITNNTNVPNVTSTFWRVVSPSNIVTPSDLQTSNYIFGVNTGTANAIIVAPSPSYGAYAVGTVVKVLLSAPNTGAVTLQIGANAAVNVQITSTDGLSSLVGGELNTGIFEFIYLGTVFQLMNPITSATPDVPIGTVLDYASASPLPQNFLACDGSAISRATFSDLFAVIGTTWGVGDGSTTFNLPNLARSVTVGAGGTGTAILGNTVGSAGGEEQHTMLLTELVSHTHTVQASPATGSLVTVLQAIAANAPSIVSYASNSTGGGQPFNVMQPAAVMLKIIRYKN